MASFTDESHLKFDPYIQQAPVDDYLRVGMMKQEQYNQGVQEVQQAASNTSGLDIVQGAQKQYLQNSMNNVGGELKKYAGADYSNQQLVNSLTGMINKVSKDPIIQNGVSSTMNYRKGLADMQEARKAGKSAASNEYDYMDNASTWLNGDINSSFNSSYTPYNSETRKKVVDTILKLHPNLKQEDISYNDIIGKDGEIQTRQILDIMRRQKIEGVDAGQIKTALGAVLDANDYNQLAIDGKYYLKDRSAYDLKENATLKYNQSKEQASKQISEITDKLKTTSDIGAQNELNQRLNYYKNLIGDPSKNIEGLLDQQYRTDISSIDNDIKGARGRIYTNNFIDEVSNGFSWRHVTEENMANPAREDMWKRLNYDLANRKESREAKHQTFEENLATKKDKREEKEFEFKYGKDGVGKEGNWTLSGDPSNQDLESLKNFSNYNNELSGSNSAILQTLAKNVNRLNPEKVDVNVLKQKIQDYKDGKPSGNPANNAEKELMDNYLKNTQLLENNKKIYETYHDQAYKELTGGLDEKKELENQLSSYHSLSIPINDKMVDFTPTEIYNYLNKEKITQSASGGIGGGGALRIIDYSQLSDKEKLLAKYANKRYGGLNAGHSGEVGDKVFDNYINSYNPILLKQKDISQKVTDLTAKKLGNVTGIFRTEQSEISFKSAEQEKNFNNSLISVIDADINLKTGDINYDTKAAMSLLAKKQSEPDNVVQLIVKDGNNNYIKLVDKASPNSAQIIKVPSGWVANNTALGSTYLNKNTDLAQNFLANNGSTNIFNDPNQSYYKKGEFGKIDQYGKPTVTLPIIGADLDEINGGIYAKIYIKDKNGNTITANVPYPIDPNKFTEYLGNVKDSDLLSFFKTKYPNIKQLIK